MGNSLATTKLSRFQLLKLRYEFRCFLDWNHDGKVSWEDIDNVRHSVTEARHWRPCEVRYLALSVQFVKIWNVLVEYLDRNWTGKLNEEEEWIEAWKCYYLDTQMCLKQGTLATVPEWIESLVDLKFAILDADNDGQISRDDFVTSHSVFDVDSQTSTKAFETVIKDSDMTSIDKEMFHKLYLEYMLCQEPQNTANALGGRLVYNEQILPEINDYDKTFIPRWKISSKELRWFK